MSRLNHTNRKLARRFGGLVTAREERGCLVLDGELKQWAEVVEAGRLAVDTKHYAGLVNNIRFTGGEIPPMRVPSLRDHALEGRRPDVLIIGGGVVGCAIARELSRWKLDILLVEKEHDVALQASGRNDGMVHPGVDLHKGQVKQRYNLRGNAMFEQICGDLGVPFRRTGQYLCFDQAALKPLVRLILPHWRRMGVPVKIVGREELNLAEPELDPGIRFAMFFPTAGAVCPYGLTIAYAENAVQNGVSLSLDTAVLGMEAKEGRITAVHTNRGDLYPRLVINAAGVFSDQVAEMAGDKFFSIHPRRGTNSILDKKAAHQVRTIASSLGTAAMTTTHSKGGGLVSTADGNLLVGPDAVETFDRENYETNAASVAATFAKQRRTSPTLSQGDIITYFTGVRASTYEEDFVIGPGRAVKNLLHAAGIQSPGLTAAPAIGVDIALMAVEWLFKESPVSPNPDFDPVRIPIPRAAELPQAERAALIAENPDFGVIVCRCEEISRGELLAALRRPVPCDTLDGVKRRVRPGMGRCQGGFCGPLVAKLIAEEKGVLLEQVLKSGEGSYLVVGTTKAGV